MSKQDRQGVRTASDLERKYDFGNIGKGGGSSEALSALNQTLSQFMSKTNAHIESLEQQVGELGSPPVISIDEIEGGHKITITDGEESSEVVVMDVADYIVQAGEADGWSWEMWSSGKAVCRGVFTETRSHYTTVGNFYGYYSSEFTYPIIFESIPMMHYNCRVGTGFAIPAGDVSYKKDYAKCYALSTGSGEKECVWIIEAVGKWKQN